MNKPRRKAGLSVNVIVNVPLYHLFDVPDEGTYSDLFITLVELADGIEQFINFVVGDYGQYGIVHFWPCVGATVWVTIDVTTPLDILPLGEASDAERVEHILDALVVGLVVYYHYAFHCLSNWMFMNTNLRRSFSFFSMSPRRLKMP